MTKPPRSQQPRPSQRFLQDYSKATKAQLLQEMGRLAAKNAALERKAKRLSRDNEELKLKNAKAGKNKATGGMGEDELLSKMEQIHEEAMRHMQQPLRQGERLPPNVGYAVLVLDLNHFKRVNDFYGHPEGDNVLRAAYKAMIATTRRTDVVAHTGGDEFVIVLTETSRENAVGLARDVRLEIQKTFADKHDLMDAHHVTASIGLAHFDPLTMSDRTPRDMIVLADKGITQLEGRDNPVKVNYENLVTLVTADQRKIVVDPAPAGPSMSAKPEETRPVARRSRKAGEPKT